MARTLSVFFPPKLTNSLLQLGRLTPSGNLIMDDCTNDGGLKPACELEGVHFQPIDLGYLGKFSVVTCEGRRVLETSGRANRLIKQLEKDQAERIKAEEEAALASLEPTMPETIELAEAA